MELVLYRTRVTDAGLKHLAGRKSLQTLLLAGTEITDAGLAAPGRARRIAGPEPLRHEGQRRRPVRTWAGSAALTRLNLGKTRVTDAGLKHLAGLGALKSLTLAGSGVTDAGLASLQAALPGVRIAQPGDLGVPLSASGRGGRSVVGQAVLPDADRTGSDGVRQDCLTYVRPSSRSTARPMSGGASGTRRRGSPRRRRPRAARRRAGSGCRSR